MVWLPHTLCCHVIPAMLCQLCWCKHVDHGALYQGFVHGHHQWPSSPCCCAGLATNSA